MKDINWEADDLICNVKKTNLSLFVCLSTIGELIIPERVEDSHGAKVLRTARGDYVSGSINLRRKLYFVISFIWCRNTQSKKKCFLKLRLRADYPLMEAL